MFYGSIYNPYRYTHNLRILAARAPVNQLTAPTSILFLKFIQSLQIEQNGFLIDCTGKDAVVTPG